MLKIFQLKWCVSICFINRDERKMEKDRKEITTGVSDELRQMLIWTDTRHMLSVWSLLTNSNIQLAVWGKMGDMNFFFYFVPENTFYKQVFIHSRVERQKHFD